MLAFPSFEELRELILLARREDLGSGDVTSRLLPDPDIPAAGTLVQKQAGVICGLPIVQMVCRVYDQRLQVEPVTELPLEAAEGRFSDRPPVSLMRIRGPLASLLSAERVILNFLQHMSGIATLTRQFVQQTQGTDAKIYDTRKTIPGLRVLAKYAVRCGGGHNHRAGLYDAVLIKDNHLARTSLSELVRFVSDLVARSRCENPGRMIEVEVDSLEQLRQVLKVEGLDVVMLDNMDCPTLQQAVQMRNSAGLKGKLELEASGGVTLQTVRAVALTGVERISVGAITHSAPALDIGLEIGG